MSTAARAAQPAPNAERAVIAYAALRDHFYQSRQRLFRGTASGPAANAHAYAWPYSRALAATIDLALLPGGERYRPDVRDRLAGLERYWNPRSDPPGYDSAVRSWLGPGSDQYYDDNEWIGLELVRAYHLLGDEAALDRARQVFDLVVSGWDADPSHADPGGVFWVRAGWSRDRNTVSTAPGAQLGLRLYAITQEPAYRDWAIRMYDWVYRHLRGSDGIYSDHVDLQGKVDRAPWSYNQGTMVGAGVLLARATGDGTYLEQAEETASASLAFYAVDDRLAAQGPAFNAIYFKNLLALEAVNHDGAYRRAMQGYADHVWDSQRDPRAGLFVFDPAKPTELLQQAAMVEIYATLGR